MPFHDVGLESGTEYFYRVLAVNAGGATAGVGVNAMTPAWGAPPALEVHAAKARATLTWGAVVGAAGYRIERSASGAPDWETLATVGNVLTYSDVGLAPGSTWFYRVAAAGVGAAFSPVVSSTQWTGGRIYYDTATHEYVNSVTGARRAASGVVWLALKNVRKDFQNAARRRYRDWPRRRAHS